jgi:hypothetical protein
MAASHHQHQTNYVYNKGLLAPFLLRRKSEKNIGMARQLAFEEYKSSLISSSSSEGTTNEVGAGEAWLDAFVSAYKSACSLCYKLDCEISDSLCSSLAPLLVTTTTKSEETETVTSRSEMFSGQGDSNLKKGNSLSHRMGVPLLQSELMAHVYIPLALEYCCVDGTGTVSEALGESDKGVVNRKADEANKNAPLLYILTKGVLRVVEKLALEQVPVSTVLVTLCVALCWRVGWGESAITVLQEHINTSTTSLLGGDGADLTNGMDKAYSSQSKAAEASSDTIDRHVNIFLAESITSLVNQVIFGESSSMCTIPENDYSASPLPSCNEMKNNDNNTHKKTVDSSRVSEKGQQVKRGHQRRYQATLMRYSMDLVRSVSGGSVIIAKYQLHQGHLMDAISTCLTELTQDYKSNLNTNAPRSNNNGVVLVSSNNTRTRNTSSRLRPPQDVQGIHFFRCAVSVARRKKSECARSVLAPLRSKAMQKMNHFLYI